MEFPIDVVIRRLCLDDVPVIVGSNEAATQPGPAAQYYRYLTEQSKNERVILAAFSDAEFSGYVSVVWASGYPPFREAGIPEIHDLNVLPFARRKGIAGRLMDEAEKIAGTRAQICGLGVGLHRHYGPAQRLYVLRGYVPDGLGIWWANRQIEPGDEVHVDDGLALYLTKTLR